MDNIKNYTVRWRQWGKQQRQTYFPSLEEARDFVRNVLEDKDYIADVLILRAGRHPSAPRWNSGAAKRAKHIRKSNNEIVLDEEVWKVPVGFVDGDADKHGPVVSVPVPEKIVVRTDAEKAEWYKDNKHTMDNRTCLWM